MNKPILCLDFDGVIHSYSSGWKGPDNIPDLPVPGSMRFIWQAAEDWEIAIFSSRSHQPGGKRAMRNWLTKHFREYWAADRTRCDDILAEIKWPSEKPPAFVTIDDRAICFDGTWPDLKELRGFRPWNKKPAQPVELGVTDLRQQIISEIMKLLPGVLEPKDQKPTVEELEKILNSESAEQITINPDGSIGQYRPAKVGDVVDAVMRIIAPHLKN